MKKIFSNLNFPKILALAALLLGVVGLFAGNLYDKVDWHNKQ